MNTLSTIFLHSARMYSSMADGIFKDSVEWSQFASTVSNMRMQVTKTISGTPLDIQVDLDDEDIEILTAEDGWQSCLALDNLLMCEMARDEAKFLPLLQGVYVAAHRGAAFASRTDDRPMYKLCLGCGAISMEWQCPVCSNGRNWLVGVEIPENTEAPETIVDTSKNISLPNLSFADFPPEMPVQPRRWEVIFDDGREDDIFKVADLRKPSLS